MLLKVNVFLSLKKTFLEYLNIALLSQKINAFELIIAEDKLKAITSLQYLTILRSLKHYLNLTDYLRNYVYYYA